MKRIILLIVLFFILTITVYALEADLRSVEIDLVLRLDGKADVYYTLDWYVTGGEMHGFYFQGAAATPVFNMEHCFADPESGRRIPLEIIDLGRGKYDVILEKGEGFNWMTHSKQLCIC